MPDSFRPEEIDWFNILKRTFEEREERLPDFSAADAYEAMTTAFFSDVGLTELITIDDELWRIINETHIPKQGESAHLRMLYLSWLAVTFRHAHSSFLLAQQGFRDTSAANARVALDHAIYLSLLAKISDRQRIADRMEALYLKYLKGFGDALTNTDTVLDDFFRVALDELPGLDPGSKTWSDIVEQICDQLDSGKIVYSRYRILSSLMHVGFPSAEPFIYSVRYDTDPNFNWNPVINPASVIGFMAVASCIWAAWSIDHILEEIYFGDRFDSFAARLQLHRLFTVHE